MSKGAAVGILAEGAQRLSGYVSSFPDDPIGTVKKYYMNETYLPGSNGYKKALKVIEPMLEVSFTPKKKRKAARQDPESPDKTEETGQDVGIMEIHPSTTCCIDLGIINLNKYAKGGSRGDRVREELLEFPELHEEYKNITRTSDIDRRSFQTLFTESLSTGNDPGGVASTANWVNINIAKLNSCEQIQQAFNEYSFVNPSYHGVSAAQGVTDAGDGRACIVLDNQTLTLMFKNIAKNTIPAGGGDDAISTTPAFCNLWIFQATQNIYRVDALDTAVDETQRHLNSSWVSAYAQDQPLGFASNHKLGITWSENPWLKENFKPVSHRGFCLTPGQEGHLQIVLTVPQVLSSKYTLEAVVGDTDTALTWNPVYIKKGEFIVFWDQRGGLHPMESPAPEESKVIIYGVRKYRTYIMDTLGSVVKRNQTINLGTTPANYTNADVDIEHQ